MSPYPMNPVVEKVVTTFQTQPFHDAIDILNEVLQMEASRGKAQLTRLVRLIQEGVDRVFPKGAVVVGETWLGRSW